MSSFGERLREGRERKDISLEEVSRATKISLNVLQALENEQYDDLPPKVYVRGFIRSYSRYVGLDETELLRSYEEAAAEKKTGESRARGKATIRSARTRLLLLLVLLAALLALFIHDSFFIHSDMGGVSPEPPKDTRAMKVGIPPAQPAAIPEERGSPLAPSSVRLVVKCIVGTWLELSIDHDRPFEVNLLPGEELCWAAEKSIELKIGNAGGVNITVNEIPLRPFDKPEEVLKLLFEGDEVCLNDGEPQNLRLWERQNEISIGE